MRTSCLAGPVFAASLTASAFASQDSPLQVVAQVRPGTYYVGQSVDLSVGVVAERERPVVTTPVVPGADVTFVKTDLKPISAGGIGGAVFEKNLYLVRYRLIPRRAAVLTVPPIRARLDDRAGSSAPVSVPVRSLPAAGRPAEFLGGVGAFEVEAGAEPTLVRVGEPIEYRVTVRGPAARGTTSAPSLGRLRGLPLGLAVEPGPPQDVADPPSHTFVFRLRPTRAGEATLPPVAVAAFDPRSSAYVTKVTTGIPIRVTEAPKFDPAQVAYDPVATRTGPTRSWRAVGVPGVVAAGLFLAVGLVLWVGLRRAGRTRRPLRRFLDGVEVGLGSARDEPERGRVLTEALIAYLGLTVGRPPGALTPEEAAHGVERATGSDALAARASRLVRRCDLAQFGRGEPAEDDLDAEGRAFFRALAGAALRAGGTGTV